MRQDTRVSGGSHLPGAANIPWGMAVEEANGTFRSVEGLRMIYGGTGIKGDRETITCCRTGECPSHTWFVLTQILGYGKVRNYDGSWSDYPSIVGAPIER